MQIQIIKRCHYMLTRWPKLKSWRNKSVGELRITLTLRWWAYTFIQSFFQTNVSLPRKVKDVCVLYPMMLFLGMPSTETWVKVRRVTSVRKLTGALSTEQTLETSQRRVKWLSRLQCTRRSEKGKRGRKPRRPASTWASLTNIAVRGKAVTEGCRWGPACA